MQCILVAAYPAWWMTSLNSWSRQILQLHALKWISPKDLQKHNSLSFYCNRNVFSEGRGLFGSGRQNWEASCALACGLIPSLLLLLHSKILHLAFIVKQPQKTHEVAHPKQYDSTVATRPKSEGLELQIWWAAAVQLHTSAQKKNKDTQRLGSYQWLIP